MKITAFNGSPKGKNSCSHVLVNAFLEGASGVENVETKEIFLSEKKFDYCSGCFSCWIKTPGKCIKNDDMKDLLEEFSNADIVIFATPLYVDNVSGLMKTFMDRMLPIFDPYIIEDENNVCVHNVKLEKEPNYVVMSNCGFYEFSNFDVLDLLFDRLARNSRGKVLAKIFRPEGPLLKYNNFFLKHIVNKYLKAVKIAGREIASGETLSAETKEKLRKPLVKKSMYINGANKVWDKALKK